MIAATCEWCGGPMTRVCRPCRSADAEERVRLIVAMWARGALLREIAGELGTTVNCLGGEMVRLRAKGYDLPYRYHRPDLASPAERHRTQADGLPYPSREGGPPSPAGAAFQTFNAKRPAMPGGPQTTNGGIARRDHH